jgi:ComF family protein
MRVLELLLPPACAGCGHAGSLLCKRCVARLRPPFDAADRFVAPDAGVLVGDRLTVAIAAYAYDGPMRRALAALKYTGAASLAPILAGLAEPTLGRVLAIAGDVALVPVPVHRERRRERGYNQAEAIARALGSRAGRPTLGILERVRPTTKQHRLDRAARLANMRDAFAVRASVRALPRAVIVVDDIITTGATLEACASVLRRAGVEDVYGFAVAREV